MNKKTILIIIDNLGRGGAETLLVGILPGMVLKYNVILVTLSDLCEFSEEEIICHKRYSLGFTGKLSFPACIVKLRKIIRFHQPQMLHAHLLNSSIIARIACPKKIPFIYTVHSILSLNAFNGSWLYRNIENLLFNEKDFLIAVSNEVLKDYQAAIGKNLKTVVLKNYITDSFFNVRYHVKEITAESTLKIVAVGNIKRVKNYEYLIDTLMHLEKYKISLDIYGKGEDEYVKSLQEKIDRFNLPISFKGTTESIFKILTAYDLYVMSSSNEGFGMAAIEAMSIGLPVLLSDIPVLREVTFNNALFFDIENPEMLANLIKEILEGKHNLNGLSQKGKEIAQQYSRQKHEDELFSIYDNILQ